jgi:hypothetical protein
MTETKASFIGFGAPQGSVSLHGMSQQHGLDVGAPSQSLLPNLVHDHIRFCSMSRLVV